MVRGDERCPHFCNVCCYDCICQDEDCFECHTCRDTDIVDGSRVNYIECGANSHDCDKYLKKQKLAQENEKGEQQERLNENLKKFPQLFSSEIVKITIGNPDGDTPPEIRFVPKRALVENSEYFKASFSFAAAVGSGGVVDLTAIPDETIITLSMDVDRPDAFDRFIQFAFWKDYLTDNEDDESIMPHARVYVLAERLQSDGLKNLSLQKATKIAVICSERINDEEDEEVVNTTCVLDLIETVYSNTPATDRFRNLIATFCASCLDKLTRKTKFKETMRMFPDFAVDVVTRVPKGKEMEVGEDGYLKVE